MKSERDFALDFVKGCCVLGMIVHHSFDYFPVVFLLKKYVRFITGSFIFLSGFLITNIYLAKYDIHKENEKLRSRLLIRGGKIFLIFTFLNIALELMIHRNFGVHMLNPSYFFDVIYTVYILGSYKTVAFELLVPISYTLLIAGVFVFVMPHKIKLLVPFSVLLLLYCSFFHYYQEEAYNLRFITIGILGAALGYMQFQLSILRRYWYGVVILFIINSTIVTLFRLGYPIYVFDVICNLLFFYLLGSIFNYGNLFYKYITLLGRYSLFSYLFQIFILQVISRVVKAHFVCLDNVIFGFCITLFSTIMVILLLDYYRFKSNFVSYCYDLIFS